MSKSKDSLALVVKKYLEKTNRPFSATDVYNNLNTKDSKLGKTAVNKALEELVANKKIKEKENGKQKVYFIDQNVFGDIDDNQMKQMDQQLDQLNKEFTDIKTEIKQKESKVLAFKNCLSFEQISQQLSEVKEELNQLEKRWQTIGTKAKDFDPKENQILKNERQKLVNEWKKRKRMATDIIDMVLENYHKPKKALIEEIQMETDEEYKVSLPQI